MIHCVIKIYQKFQRETLKSSQTPISMYKNKAQIIFHALVEQETEAAYESC